MYDLGNQVLLDQHTCCWHNQKVNRVFLAWHISQSVSCLAYQSLKHLKRSRDVSELWLGKSNVFQHLTDSAPNNFIFVLYCGIACEDFSSFLVIGQFCNSKTLSRLSNNRHSAVCLKVTVFRFMLKTFLIRKMSYKTYKQFHKN